MSWSDLPADLVAAIAERISAHADLARFRSACPSWRSASAEHAARCRAPLLLLPSQDHFTADRRFWSLAEDIIAKIPVPAARRHPFLFASPRGWVLAVDHYFSATLIHTFTGASAALPELPPAFRDIVNNIVLRDMVWDQSPRGVVIMRGKGAPCAFFCWREGDGGSTTRWSLVECPQLAEISSVTYCDDDGGEIFYLFDGGTGKTAALDGATFAVAAVIEPPPSLMPMPQHLRRGAAVWEWDRRKPEFTSTLVVSFGELLLIVRTRPLHHPGGSNGSGELFKAF
ncbi:hypothetical protein BRADI_2g23100v3 [Brachypodium distachyon]|uniref:KIB1-4 beta-propeller domain-containing protein n=1 Tax=Brachypodium distachyon TaxID=15368 RepID=I1HIN9_BRADI|nr:hypothetical protein BRADI_2g23100v3 [Brachypodium distachyon]